MELSLSANTPCFQSSSPPEMGLTRLPSWGDPILADLWTVQSAAEMDTHFAWHGDSLTPHSDDEDDDDCLPMILVDPSLDREMISLFRNIVESEDFSCGDDSRRSGIADDDAHSMSRDDDSYQERDEDDMESRCSVDVDESTSTDDDSDSLSLSTASQSSDECMVYESEEEDSEQCHSVVSKASPTLIEWSVEAHYDRNILCFKLRAASGPAYMQLMADEIEESLQALIEDCMDVIHFQVHCVNGHVILVDSTLVISVMSRILASQPRIITPTQEEREPEETSSGEELIVTEDSWQRKTVHLPALPCRRRPKDYIASRKRKNPLGSAWRNLSARAKIRPPALVRVE